MRNGGRSLTKPRSRAHVLKSVSWGISFPTEFPRLAIDTTGRAFGPAFRVDRESWEFPRTARKNGYGYFTAPGRAGQAGGRAGRQAGRQAGREAGRLAGGPSRALVRLEPLAVYGLGPSRALVRRSKQQGTWVFIILRFTDAMLIDDYEVVSTQ